MSRAMLSLPPHALKLSVSNFRGTSKPAKRPLWVDTVEKVENRVAPKISRKSVFGCLRRCKALYDRSTIAFVGIDVVPHMPRARRASGAEKFCSSPRKDFFNSIGHFQTSRRVRVRSVHPPTTDMRRVHRLVRFAPKADLGWYRVSAFANMLGAYCDAKRGGPYAGNQDRVPIHAGTRGSRF